MDLNSTVNVEPILEDTARQEITLILQNAERAEISDRLFPLIYDELRRLASSQLAKERPGQTLQPTALVHECYLRLLGKDEVHWKNRAHFFGAAARSMRQILINRAVQKQTQKHGGTFNRRELDDHLLAVEPPPERLLALDEALSKLENFDARLSQIVMLRYFAGLSIDDTAKAIDCSSATVSRDWKFARTWLAREMGAT